MLFMQEQSDRRRITWLARISVRPSDREALKIMSSNEIVSVATLIGRAIENYVTARSTA